MAYTWINPLTDEVEVTLSATDTAQDLIRSAVIQVWGNPQTDIITNILRCTVARLDPVAVKLGSQPMVIITITTSDEDKLANSQPLKGLVRQTWRNAFPTLKAEINVVRLDDWAATFDISA